ncbi:MAG: putative metal-binding motif-containing protein [Deltaproteobacteria bacterium]|nr:putative metal-binding motif-containing protein [Deltaproteobacteria bacterium]
MGPDAEETAYNGLDDDCDPLTPDDDLDGDGFGLSDDCDDDTAEVNPDAEERCDGLDNNCDGLTDDGAAAPTTWYADLDLDGYGDGAVITSACDAPTGHRAQRDCDDSEIR